MASPVNQGGHYTGVNPKLFPISGRASARIADNFYSRPMGIDEGAEAQVGGQLPANAKDGAIAYFEDGSWKAMSPGKPGSVFTIVEDGTPMWVETDLNKFFAAAQAKIDALEESQLDTALIAELVNSAFEKKLQAAAAEATAASAPPKAETAKAPAKSTATKTASKATKASATKAKKDS